MSNVASHIVLEILHYLVLHPDAKDSAEGIRRWWLSSSSALLSDEEIEKALSFIVAHGWLEERNVTPNQRVFAARQGAMNSIAEHVHQHCGTMI